MEADVPALERRWRAMGSDIHLIVVGGTDDHLDRAQHRVAELEQRWSRFLPDSEISRLNDHAGELVEVSDDTVLLVRRSIEAWRVTGGGFDPTLLDALRRAGYDRSFDDVQREPSGDHDLPPLRFDRPGVTDIEVGDNAVLLPAGCGVDPGGIGKGLTADLVAEQLLVDGAQGALVNMGGDVRVAGRSPSGTGWTLGIEHPWQHEPIALVGLWNGAVTTSTVLKRTWQVDGRTRHHLIDPATGAPSTSDVALATVIGGDAWMAEVLAKAALLRGVDRAFDLLDQTQAGLVVDHDGVVHVSPTFTSFSGGVLPTSPVPAHLMETP